MNTDEEDDPVVDEIPVFLTKKLENQLYVFQYPLRPNSERSPNVLNASYKPVNKEVKLECSIDTQSANFDLYKAEQLGQAANKPIKGQKQPNKLFEDDIADRVFYQSSKVTPNTSSYAIGAFNGTGCYLTPLEGYLQLRPSLDFLNKCLKSKKSNDDEEDDEEVAVAAEAVTVEIKGDTAAHKELTYHKYKEMIEREKWLDCEFNSESTHDCEYFKSKLLNEQTDDVTHLFNVKSGDYVRMLIPEDEQEVQIKPALPSNVMSLQALKLLSIQDQLRLLLKDAKIIQFEQLKLLLTSGQKSTSSDTILANLPQVAVLVKGNWVVKSDILYPPNTFSAVSGVSAELMCRARDYVLYLFTKNQYVDRRKVSATIRLPPEEVKEIITGIAKLKYNKGWELLVAPDEGFMHKHIEVCQRQNLLWEQRWQQLNEFYKDVPKEKRRRKSRSFSEDPRKSDKEDNDSGTERKSPKSTRKEPKNKKPH